MLYLQIRERTYHLKWPFRNVCITQFSVYILYCNKIVFVTYTKFLYMDMTIALKLLNEMQQTANMRLTIIQHDTTVIYVT